MEGDVLNQFRDVFLESTLPCISEENIFNKAVKVAARNGTDPNDELEKVRKEYEATGEYLFSFDSGTSPAFKQQRHKLLMAQAGSLNLEIDEIGSNISNCSELLATYLETFDQGLIKQKLIKNTSDNARSAEIFGKVPTNLMMFGTPSKLMNGGKEENEYIDLLTEGYGRRCFFGNVPKGKSKTVLTAEELYDLHTDPTANKFIDDLSNYLGNLADKINFNKTLQVSKNISILLIKYRMDCEDRASKLPEHEELRRAELSHRYFKALKLAGAYAFIDGNHEITEDILYSAIKLAEESGESFNTILSRERSYVKLAKYISNIEREVTLVDLTEDLPFFKGSASQKNEMLTLAIAYGYKNNIIIKKSYLNSIEFFSGESIKETDIDNITISYSKQLAEGYSNQTVKFTDLHKLTQATGYHWVAHHLQDNYRKEDNVISGFNLIVIDIDSGCSLHTAKLLLKQFTYHIYTTKRHTEDNNRFRIVFPMSHVLKLTKQDYVDFMKNVYDFLPFNSDEQTNQRSRKWESFNKEFYYNEGELFDVLPLIPKTTKEEERTKILNNSKSLDNLQRWFCINASVGNRSNQIIKYAFALVDTGLSYDEIKDKVYDLNSKLKDKLTHKEIENTILISLTRKIQEKSKDNNE